MRARASEVGDEEAGEAVAQATHDADRGQLVGADPARAGELHVDDVAHRARERAPMALDVELEVEPQRARVEVRRAEQHPRVVGTLTLYASNSLCQVYNQLAATPEAILLCYADALYNLGSPNVYGFNQSLVVMGFEHADVIRANGWSRRDVQTFLVENCRRRVGDLKRAARLPGELTANDDATWRYGFASPDDLLIVCAGGAGSWSAVLPGWGNKWTRSVTTLIETPGGVT